MLRPRAAGPGWRTVVKGGGLRTAAAAPMPPGMGAGCGGTEREPGAPQALPVDAGLVSCGGWWTTVAAPGPQARARASCTERRPVTRSVSGRSGRSGAEGGTLAHYVAPRPQAWARGPMWHERERVARSASRGSGTHGWGRVVVHCRSAGAAGPGAVWWSWPQVRAARLRPAGGGRRGEGGCGPARQRRCHQAWARCHRQVTLRR